MAIVLATQARCDGTSRWNKIWAKLLRGYFVLEVLTKPLTNLGGVFMSVNGDRMVQGGIKHF